jgi:hypothetical protein
MTMSQTNPTIDRLDQQIDWYDGASVRSQRCFKSLKVLAMAAAGLVPVCWGFGLPQYVGAVLASLVLMLEAVQQLNQYQHNWMSYRSTCEALKHEKYLYLAKAGPYSLPGGSEGALAFLAERIESIISREHAKWISALEHAGAPLSCNRKPV